MHSSNVYQIPLNRHGSDGTPQPSFKQRDLTPSGLHHLVLINKSAGIRGIRVYIAAMHAMYAMQSQVRPGHALPVWVCFDTVVSVCRSSEPLS